MSWWLIVLLVIGIPIVYFLMGVLVAWIIYRSGCGTPHPLILVGWPATVACIIGLALRYLFSRRGKKR